MAGPFPPERPWKSAPKVVQCTAWTFTLQLYLFKVAAFETPTVKICRGLDLQGWTKVRELEGACSQHRFSVLLVFFCLELFRFQIDVNNG